MDFVEVDWQSQRYEQTLTLRERVLRRPLGLTFHPEERQAEADQLHFAIVDRDEVIACVVVVPLDAARVKLRQMAVDENRQRTGVGTALMRDVESELTRRGVTSIALHARDIAVTFYERLGYRVEGESFFEVTIPHYKMVKTLAR